MLQVKPTSEESRPETLLERAVRRHVAMLREAEASQAHRVKRPAEPKAAQR